MSKITNEQLKSGVAGQYITGVILCKQYSIQLTKTNSEYIAGLLQSGIEIPFKAWGNSNAFSTFKNSDLVGKVCKITGKFDAYGGVLSLVLTDIEAIDGFEVDEFLEEKYNIEAYWNALKDLIEKNVSEKCFELTSNILFNNTDVASKFKIEFAASYHHDNCKGGLLAHTYKVVRNVNYIINMYPTLVKDKEGVVNKDFVDLLYMGALLHDIGKTKEMNLGVYTSLSSVTHRYLGIEFIQCVKDKILSSYGEKWYYDLVSIFLQHHGEYDDKCRTLSALIVHKADIMDSEFTSLCTSCETPVESNTGNRIKVDGNWIIL